MKTGSPCFFVACPPVDIQQSANQVTAVTPALGPLKWLQLVLHAVNVPDRAALDLRAYGDQSGPYRACFQCRCLHRNLYIPYSTKNSQPHAPVSLASCTNPLPTPIAQCARGLAGWRCPRTYRSMSFPPSPAGIGSVSEEGLCGTFQLGRAVWKNKARPICPCPSLVAVSAGLHELYPVWIRARGLT